MKGEVAGLDARWGVISGAHGENRKIGLTTRGIKNNILHKEKGLLHEFCSSCLRQETDLELTDSEGITFDVDNIFTSRTIESMPRQHSVTCHSVGA
jgi:hypothetical protein